MITRFAPSPTGPLHLGHAYSAILAHDMAMAAGGQFLLRIEDIDQSRARPEWEAQIYDDLTWLGLAWPSPVMRQSDRLVAYHTALDQLWDMGVLYPCTCTRRDIKDAISAPQEGALPTGADGLIYPDTCREKPRPQTRPRDQTLRLDMKMATRAMPDQTYVNETEHGNIQTHVLRPSELVGSVGDCVLARLDMATSYHLSVVVDDAAQQVTHVVRGEDLFSATDIHIVLQRLLDLPTPHYVHHRLIRDQDGKRLAKRDDARALSTFRAEGATPQDIRRMVGL
ncbi:tRNA glutamyl-Q(34) synthetase GluQRS [Yoonia sp. 208BN28-4]|uniref:tRNA glutamyl-Q(34) synthetase GluQRS n=1 Tax=Yoonia sp. 208BN28-4 TaxID=3126505 RepID=UPI0030A68195